MKATPSTADLSRYLEVSFAACDGAGKILNSYFGNLHKVDEKFQAGLVSEADKESEKYIVDLIRSRFPGHDILGEESGLSSGSSLSSEGARASDRDARRGDRDVVLWMIDPLDGTTNYVHQFPFFCISIGLEINGELVVGVVDAPKLGTRYHAVKGGGAFLNGEPIRASQRVAFKDGLFATGFSSHDGELDEQLELLTHIVRKSRGIRRAGAAALDMCYVAQGVFDVFWEKNLQPWDTAAGTVIAREAGAIVTDMRGREFEPRMKSVLCGSASLHGEVLETIQHIRKGLNR